MCLYVASDQGYRIYNTWVGDVTRVMLLEQVLKVIKEGGLMANAEMVGQQLLDGLKALQVRVCVELALFEKFFGRTRKGLLEGMRLWRENHLPQYVKVMREVEFNTDNCKCFRSSLSWQIFSELSLNDNDITFGSFSILVYRLDVKILRAVQI